MWPVVLVRRVGGSGDTERVHRLWGSGDYTEPSVPGVGGGCVTSVTVRGCAGVGRCFVKSSSDASLVLRSLAPERRVLVLWG